MTCQNCGLDLADSSFRIKDGGRLKVCYRCEARERRGRYNPEVEAAYNASIKGVARHLRDDHGFNYADSIAIATRMCDPLETCAICGCPNHWLMDGRAVWGAGRTRRTRRLTCDHMDAVSNGGLSLLENVRLLCPGCQSAKSNRCGMYTDVEVLRAARRWYESIYSLGRLYWLHLVPGAGGRRFRNEFMQKKFERLTGRVLPMFGPLPATGGGTA